MAFTIGSSSDYEKYIEYQKMIEQKIPSTSVDRLNILLGEYPKYSRYVMNTLHEFNNEMKQFERLEKDLRFRAIKLFMRERENDISISKLPEKIKSHLKCAVRTVGNIELRTLKPKYIVIDVDLNPMSKWYTEYESANGFIRNQHGMAPANQPPENLVVVDWNELRELQYKKNGNKSTGEES